ncbi:VOC family protein [Streptomyces sp. NPDC088124]|uniref:VOC family protein n=1 Tax=Streptomyces sp. NPDC088124 TaxID=3154654 RepID=UPI0034225E55
MSRVTANQPGGTPTWIDLDVPDVERAKEFYGAVFGWEFSAPGAGGYTFALLRGSRVAGLRPVPAPASPRPPRWRVHLATDDCDATARRVAEAGGTVTAGPLDKGEQGRSALAVDPGGAAFGLWQGGTLLGCELVNEPGSLVRNDLVTPDPAPAREFYAKVFDFTLDANQDMPDADFTFLRRPDGHEIGGIMGVPEAPAAAWGTLFEVADTDGTARRAVAAGGTAGEPEDTLYVRMAGITDPFGAVFQVGARPPAARAS